MELSINIDIDVLAEALAESGALDSSIDERVSEYLSGMSPDDVFDMDEYLTSYDLDYKVPDLVGEALSDLGVPDFTEESVKVLDVFGELLREQRAAAFINGKSAGEHATANRLRKSGRFDPEKLAEVLRGDDDSSAAA